MPKAVSRPQGDDESISSAVSSSEEISDMKGQWKGEFEGTNNGSVILDMDEGRSSFDGIAFLTDNSPDLPNYLVKIAAPKNKKEFTTKVSIIPVFRGEELPPKRFVELFPNAQLSNHAETSWTVDERTIKIDWKTEAGTIG